MIASNQRNKVSEVGMTIQRRNEGNEMKRLNETRRKDERKRKRLKRREKESKGKSEEYPYFEYLKCHWRYCPFATCGNS